MKKAFLLTQFGPPFPWAAKLYENFQRLAPYGFDLIVLSSTADKEVRGNVTIIPMTLDQFNDRVYAATSIRTGNTLDVNGVPSKLTSDYYPAFGEIFADLLAGYDYWSITNWDVVFGRLDHFLPDSELAKYDIWSDDRGHINSLCCFYRNVPEINALYRQVKNWQQMFCYTGQRFYGFDEVHFNGLIRMVVEEGRIRFGHPSYFPLHSYDRLVQHTPEPQLTFAPDWALIEIFEDSLASSLKHYAPFRGYFGREIMYFHFIRTKKWPTFKDWR